MKTKIPQNKSRFLIFLSSIFVCFSCSKPPVNEEKTIKYESSSNFKNIALVTNLGNVSIVEDLTLEIPEVHYFAKYIPLPNEKTYIDSNITHSKISKLGFEFDVINLFFQHSESKINEISIELKINPTITSNLYTEISVGNLEVNSSTSLDYLEAKILTGNTNIISGKFSSLNIETETGNVEGEGSVINFQTFLNTGNISFKNNEIAASISSTIEASGNIDFKISEPPSGFELFYEISVGKISSDTYSSNIKNLLTDHLYIKTSSESKDVPLYEFSIEVGNLFFNAIN